MCRYLTVCEVKKKKRHILRASVWTQYSILGVFSSRDQRRFIIHLFSSFLYSSHYEVKCSYWLNSTWLPPRGNMLWEMFNLQLTESNSVQEWSPDLHWEGQPVAGLWEERGNRAPGPRRACGCGWGAAVPSPQTQRVCSGLIDRLILDEILLTAPDWQFNSTLRCEYILLEW